MTKTSRALHGLDSLDVDRFHRLGYLLLPGFLPGDLVADLQHEADRWVDSGLRERSIACCRHPERYGLPPVVELDMPAHGRVVGHPPLLEILRELIGDAFVFHHLHSVRLAPDEPGKPWHHDYEQRPQSNRDSMMLHTLHYLDGLDVNQASLVLFPGSHRDVAAKDAWIHLGTSELAGEALVDDLPRGSTVLLHSALFHARRPRPGGRAGCARYMVDASYCQVGTTWPPVKPFWRHILQRGQELGLDGGRWPELFSARHFSEYRRQT